MKEKLRLLLFPISLVYGLVVVIRNWLYDKGIFQSEKFDLPVISVGNLAVGGSGKTPVTEYLVNLLPAYKIAILSRGYGRKTKGFILADASASATTIGDEPMQYYRKFPAVTVAVCENRATGIHKLKATHDVIILDDAFQHRRVIPGFSLLLFDYATIFRSQFLLPAGNLREPFNGYKRAQAILITKAPEAIDARQRNNCQLKFDENHPPFFSSLLYDDLIPLDGGIVRDLKTLTPQTKIFLLTGIANPVPLETFLHTHGQIYKHYEFPDHYPFKQEDIIQLTADFNAHAAQEKIIITTEKDAQRLFTGTLHKLLVNLPVYYLPVRIGLYKDKAAFDTKILDYVASIKRNH